MERLQNEELHDLHSSQNIILLGW